MRLGDATWSDVQTLLNDPIAEDGTRAPLVLIPVGSTEQHGPHLPMSTDTLIAEEIVARAMHLTDGLMVGPTLTVRIGRTRRLSWNALDRDCGDA